MLTLLQNKNIKFVLNLIAAVSVVFVAVPVTTATAATSKSELIKNITQELSPISNYAKSGSGQVLGQQTAVPFFPRGFVYPIPELGNCDSKGSCFQFCEAQENLELCSMVSYRNGLMSASQLKKTLTFVNYLHSGYFASCNDLGSCAQICDQKEARADCDLLAANLDKGSRVLGATDTNTENNFSLIEYCKTNASCYNQNGSNTIITALDTLIKSGQAPRACTNAEHCDEYCSAAGSTECNDLFTKLSYMTGTLIPTNYPGRVLNASTENIQDLAQQQDLPTVTEATQIAYQPQGALSCMMERQSVPTPLVISDAEQTDNFVQNTQRCDQKYSATQSQAANYASSGKSKALSGINNIYSCVIGLTSSADIEQCLDY